MPPTLLDRSAIESLFQISPRQASRILHWLGARQSGGARVITHQELLERLQALQQDPQVMFEQRRRSRLAAHLMQAQRENRSRRIEIPPAPSPSSIEALPKDIRLSPSHLEISFTTPVDLLQKMMQLTNSIQEDWNGFEALTSAQPDALKNTSC